MIFVGSAKLKMFDFKRIEALLNLQIVSNVTFLYKIKEIIFYLYTL